MSNKGIIKLKKGASDTMMKKFKVVLLLVSLSFSLCLMSNTYSRYVAAATGNVEVLFANWQILVNEEDITNNTSSTISITPVVDTNEYVSPNKIAPSSKGYFDIEINPSNVDVSFNYTISLEYDNENMPDIVITKYAILDENYIEGNDLDLITLTDNKITNTLNYNIATAPEEFSFKPFTIRVFFEWYEGENELMNDEADSDLGNSAATEDTSFKINATISFEQKLN